MTTIARIAAVGFALIWARSEAGAVQLKVSREALQRTLQQQLFNGPSGRYYLKGSAQGGCFVYAEDPEVLFDHDRIVVRMKTHAKIGTSLRGACVGISLAPISEVSLAPDGEGETLGFRDARLERISEQRELNFLLTPFLNHTVPARMKVNAAQANRGRRKT